MRQATCIALFVFLTSCGSSDISPNNPNPKSSEEAMRSLSPKHRDAFENWKTRLIKSCDGSDIFGANGNPATETGIDLATLLKANGQSLVVAEGNQVALLGGANSFSGYSESQVEQSESFNDKTYKLQAQLKREGFHCTVSLYGQKVFETDIAQSVDLLGYWDGQPSEAGEEKTLNVSRFGVTNYTEVPNHGFIEAFEASSLPTKRAIAYLSKRYGVAEEKTSAVFRFASGNLQGFASGRLMADHPSVWINKEYPRLPLASETSQRLIQNAPQTFDFEWNVALPKEEGGSLHFNSTIQVAKNAQNGTFQFTTLKTQYLGIQSFERTQASDCVTSRSRLFHILDTNTRVSRISPTVDEALSPCAALSKDIGEQAAKDGTLKSLVADMVRGMSPSPHTQYNGWEKVIGRLAFAAAEAKLNVADELDPEGKSILIKDLSAYLKTLDDEVQKSANLTSGRKQIYELGLNWSLKGFVVPANKISRMIAAVDNAWVPFKDSAGKFLEALAAFPNEQESTVAFALNLDTAYKTEANHALELAQALDYTEWRDSSFGVTLQRQFSKEDFTNWAADFSKVQSEITKYPGVQSIRGRLTGLALKWAKGGESWDAIGQAFASIQNATVPFKDSTDQLLSSLSTSLAENRPALDFARNLTAEYKQTAVAVKDKATALEMSSWATDFFNHILQKQPSSQQVMSWNAMLDEANRFTQREHARMQGDSEFTNESYRKEWIETALKENWTKESFAQLEQIAELAKYKGGCDFYKGASSLAHCAGVSSQNFFSPKFNGRYGALAQDFVRYLGVLPEQTYYSMRISLLNAFFGSFNAIWSACADQAYDAKVSALQNQISTYVNESDQFKKWDYERSIKTTLENCNN